MLCSWDVLNSTIPRPVCCVGGMPLSPTAASTTVGSPTPFTFSCSLASSAAPGGGDVMSVFELNKPVNGQHCDDSALPSVQYRPSFLTRFMQLFVLTVTTSSTCMENLEMSGILTAISEMLGILLKVREVSGKNLVGKGDLKIFIVSCIFASIPVFSGTSMM